MAGHLARGPSTAMAVAEGRIETRRSCGPAGGASRSRNRLGNVPSAKRPSRTRQSNEVERADALRTRGQRGKQGTALRDGECSGRGASGSAVPPPCFRKPMMTPVPSNRQNKTAGRLELGRLQRQEPRSAERARCIAYIPASLLPLLRAGIPSNCVLTPARDYSELVSRLNHDRATCAYFLDPCLLPAEVGLLEGASVGSPTPMILLTHLQPASVRAVLQHVQFATQALLFAPLDGQEKIGESLSFSGDRQLPLAFLRHCAPWLQRAPDGLMPALVALMVGTLRLSSVKTLASYCSVTPRSVERWCGEIGVPAGRLLTCTRIVHARCALDRGLAAPLAARVAGYSRSTAMWRAIANALRIEPHAFRTLAHGNLLQQLEACLDLEHSNGQAQKRGAAQ